MIAEKMKNDIDLIKNVAEVIKKDFSDTEDSDCYVESIQIKPIHKFESMKVVVNLAYGIKKLSELYGDRIEYKEVLGEEDIPYFYFYKNGILFTQYDWLRKGVLE